MNKSQPQYVAASSCRAADGSRLFVARSPGILMAISALTLCFTTGSVQSALEPDLSISVNGGAQPSVYRGMPLLVTVALTHPDAFQNNLVPIVIAPDSGGWSTALTFQLADTSGPKPLWPMQAAELGSTTVTLDTNHYGEFSWWVAPSQSSLMSTGRWQLSASLAITNPAISGGWTGAVTALTASLDLLDEPATLTEEEAFNKTTWLARYDYFNGQPQSAMSRLDQFLTSFPTDTTALWAKAQLLENAGRVSAALTLIESALDLTYAANPNPSEPPTLLIEVRRRLQKKLLLPSAISLSQSAGLVSLQWNSYPGVFFTVESSTNMQTWSTIGSQFAAGSNNIFSVTNTKPIEFFRLGIP